MSELPREWRYLDIGMVIGTILVISGIIFLAISALHSNPGIQFIIGVILAILGVIVTIWVAYAGTRIIKRELR